MTDELIMEAVKRGELQQATLLFERYHKRIFNFLARMTMDRALAEDLTQNVFLRIIKYRTSYREGNKFQSWIYQVARNVFSDHYQANKNKFSDFVDVEKISDHMADLEEHEAQDEKEKLLHQSMARLSEEQRELLVLTRFQQMKYEEVAAIMDTTVANIKVKVHRAILKLREYYFEMEKI
ncbi:sigma-70 family RNA polymerase sigma factor [Fulvivirgaceae bacterium PWU4]|uniref:RNA polymerase sigma factor n=1 Tax=Chryseosolibacter histidini TaxID=2782349 RepID=A0AAP2DH52_9BACT|nr:sigma-70 family RNA polymerase sigma factor [Chryseosolibacter histidini]MBT1696150.1 sigma-70 family RNA polymerase sigma factor [Chryseosolibacter histidini]